MSKSPASAGRSIIDEICSRVFGEMRPWPVMMVRPMNMAIVPVYDKKGRLFTYVRVALSRHAAKRLRKHRRICTYVKSLGLGFQVPEQFAEGTCAGFYYQVESEVPGIDGRRAPRKAAEMCCTAVESLGDMCLATRGFVTQSTIRCWIRRMRFVDKMGLFGTFVSQQYLEDMVRSTLVELRFTCLAQNDFHLGNIRFDRRGKVTSIIDWDIADKVGLPGADLCHLLVDSEMTIDGRGFAEAVRRILDKTNRTAEQCLSLYKDGTGLNLDRYNLVAGYLLVDMWREAYFLYTEEIRKDCSEYKLLASQVMMAFEIIQRLISNRNSV
jgi:hypothetical protein